jgi:hypothetical protein
MERKKMKRKKIIELCVLCSMSSGLMGTFEGMKCDFNDSAAFEGIEYDPNDPSTFGYGAIITKKFENVKKIKDNINKNMLERQKASLRHNRTKTPYFCFTNMQNILERFDLACAKIDQFLLGDDFEINALRESLEKLIELAQFYLEPHERPYSYFIKNNIIKTVNLMLKHLEYILRSRL